MERIYALVDDLPWIRSTRMLGFSLIILLIICNSSLCQTMAKGWNGEGRSLFNQSKLDEAIRAYDKSIEPDSNYADDWNTKITPPIVPPVMYEQFYENQAIGC